MATSEASRLAELIRRRTAEFKELCEGIEEEKAAFAPPSSERWSPKQIVSHVCGPEQSGHLPAMRAFLEHDTPRIDIEVENPFYSEKRDRMTFLELLAEFDAEYRSVADFVTGLSDEQLSRKAHIPILKDAPMGEYPTLAQWVEVIGDYHLGMHIDHMRETLQALPADEGMRKAG